MHCQTSPSTLFRGACMFSHFGCCSLRVYSPDARKVLQRHYDTQASLDRRAAIQHPPCPTGQVCHFAPTADCGSQSQFGTCFPIPKQCTQDYNPVCGCNGQNYLNTCIAHSYGISPRAAGTCLGDAATQTPTTGPTSVCTSNQPGTHGACSYGMFCRFTEAQACGRIHTSAGGQCVSPPTTCTKTWNPVCGCDGRNYRNDCIAHSHSVSVRHRGLCENANSNRVDSPCGDSDPKPECASGLFCDYTAEAQCGASAQGHCKERPQVCAQDYQPVCGCDSKTYPNVCSANATGVAVKSYGICPAT